jgi:hypothetical protein
VQVQRGGLVRSKKKKERGMLRTKRPSAGESLAAVVAVGEGNVRGGLAGFEEPTFAQPTGQLLAALGSTTFILIVIFIFIIVLNADVYMLYILLKWTCLVKWCGDQGRKAVASCTQSISSLSEASLTFFF